MTPCPRRVHVPALWAVLAAGAAFFPAPALGLEITIASEEIEPGERQAAVVSGLYRGQSVRLAWVDPTGRVRQAWDLTASRRGRAAVRFRTARALPGPHRVEAWFTAAVAYLDSRPDRDEGAVRTTRPGRDDDAVRTTRSETGIVRAAASFHVLAGDPPEYLAVLDVGKGAVPSRPDARPAGASPPHRDARPAGAATRDFGAFALAGPGRPSEAAGWLARVFDDGPPFLRLESARLRALRTAYEKSRSDELLARPVCLHDRSWTEQVWRWAGPRVARAARTRPWLWSLGRSVELAPDDGRLDFCRSRHCVRAFAGHLRRRYGNVGKLNRIWRTSFASFGEARPASVAEVLEALAEIERGEDVAGDLQTRLPGMLASWNDHRSFLDAVWSETLARCRGLLRAFDRRAQAGLEGVRLPGVFTGYDPTRCLRVLDWIETRPRPLDLALAHSLAPRSHRTNGFRTVTELGSPDPTLDLWRGFANGHGGAILRLPGADHLDREQEMQSLEEAFRRLEGGLAALVGCSTWEPDPVAVLYSQGSVRVEWLMQNAGVPEGEGRVPAGAALAAWTQLLADIGISAEVVGSKDVANKALRNSRARVLILPRAYVLGRAEFREIKRFVRAGGLVIADAGAGLYDEAFTDALEFHVGDLFSVERPPGFERPLRAEQGPARAPPGDLEFVSVNVPGAFVDGVGPEGLRVAEAGLRTLPGFAFAHAPGGPDDAPPPGGTPAVISSPAGRGRAVYLNLALEDYPRIRTSRGGANLRRLVRNALELAQVAPRVDVVCGDEPVWGCERNSWRLEETQVFTLWLDPAVAECGGRLGPALDAELVFDRPGYCHDALHGVLLGTSERVGVRLRPGANVFARMPYDVDGISIRARERTRGVVPEIVYEAVVETTTGFAGTHVVSQDLFGPDGARVDDARAWGGSRVIVAERGVAKGRIRMALNEPPGEYSLVLRDATTGVEGSIVITQEETELGGMFRIGGAGAR